MTFPSSSLLLKAHPEYLSMLGSRCLVPDWQGRERWRVTIYSRGWVVFQSGFVGARALNELAGDVHTHDKVNVKIAFDMTYQSSRTTLSRRVWLPNPRFPKGKPMVRLPSLNRRYPLAKRQLRSWVAKKSSSSRYAAASKVPRATNLRPSPETINSVFPSTEETNRDPVTGGLGPVRTTVTARSKLVFSRVWSGVRTPHFGSLKKRMLPENPHSVALIEVLSDIAIHGNHSVSDSRYSISSDLYTTRYARPDWPSHLDGARNKAISKIIDASDLGIDANLAQDMAQANQVFSLIGGNANKMIKSLKNLRRGNIPGAISALTAGRAARRLDGRIGRPSYGKSLADNWLELQYGWKPLLQDIHGVLKTLPNLFSGGGYVQSVSESGTVSEERTVTGLNASFQTGQNPVRWIHYSTRSTCRIKLRFRLANPLQAFLAQTGFTNPINLAWEILPFSFVADWCLPIGPYLEAFSAFDGLEFLDGSQTLFTKRKTVSAVDNAQINNLNPGTFVYETSRYEDEKLLFDRTKLSAFPTPTFPSFKNPFKSVSHAANGIALLVSQFVR